MAARKIKALPEEGQENKVLPEAEQIGKALPDAAQEGKALPDSGMGRKKIPNAKMKAKDLPQVGNPENTVIIGGEPIEIKATKLKYQRNRTATFYRILDLYPLTDVLSMEAGQFGDERDGDKAVMDWLIAATDNEKLITDNYDEMDTETIEKILTIFKRVNRIDEKEEKQKNLEMSRKGAV